jgi:hypothetical protein
MDKRLGEGGAMRKIVLAALLVALVGALGLAAPVGAGTGGDEDGGGTEEYPYIDPGGVDGCGSEPVEVGDPNYDGACGPIESVELGAEFLKTVEGAVVRCRVVEERITYRAKVGGNRIWDYVQQVEWCWNGISIRRINRIRFPRLTWIGGLYWDFKGHTASSCAGTGEYSPCSELAGRSSAYIATQGKFQSFTCGVKVFCITKLPGMWLKANAAGRITGYGNL